MVSSVRGEVDTAGKRTGQVDVGIELSADGVDCSVSKSTSSPP
ncbi:hypothetical protein T261_8262 [Streptomyces lydicus]|nr:hypothetical protein T261_8262 [Streptomyces lydicus]